MRQIIPQGLLIWVYVLLLYPLVSNAQFDQTDFNGEAISLRLETDVLLAGQKEYSFDEIRNNPNLEFVPLSSLKENLGFSNDHYWMTFSLENNSSKFKQYYLETARPITDIVNLYLVDDEGKVEQQYSGDKIPFSTKTIQHRKSIFDIGLEPNKKYRDTST